jgi:hypothetical protein
MGDKIALLFDMKIRNSVVAALFLGATAFCVSGQPAEKQPVLVLLHARFDDHIMVGLGQDRLLHLIALTEKLQKEFPRRAFHVSCEFSGPFVQELARTPTGLDYIRRVKEFAKTGVFDIGYIGENEPTYRNRPKAKLTDDMTTEQRWLEQATIAEHSLNDYRNLVTGELDASKAGAMRSVRETFGDPSIFGVFADELGSEAPYYHQFRRLGIRAIVPGFPDPYYTMNIHGYRVSATEIGVKTMATAQASSELFWDTNFLRASFTTSADIRRFAAEEGKEAIATALQKMDRSHIRLLQMEVTSYLRYLDKWPDGTPKLPPLVWAYDHPDAPSLPNGVKVFVDSAAIMKAYAAEEETLRWLLDSFLPENPGSRIVSPKQLLKFSKTPVGQEFPASVVADAARDWLARTSKNVNMGATFCEAAGSYFSAADLFQMLANGLTERNGKRPASVRLTHLYGPLELLNTDNYFPTLELPGREVAAAATRLAPGLNDQTWRPVPANAVPSSVELAGKKLMPAQFLALMAEAYLAPSGDTRLKLRYFQPTTAPGYMFPRQNAVRDAGHIWALRPAPLDLN